MGKITSLILFIIISLNLTNCINFGSNIPLNHIRIESVSIDKIFIRNKPAKNIRAVWYGSEVLVSYDTTDAKAQKTATVDLSFTNSDGIYYKHKSGRLGKIISVNNDNVLNEQQIEELATTESPSLVFVIYDDVRDDPYYNMVFVRGGTYNMGSRKAMDEIPIHRITVNDFYIDKYEVTVDEYIRFCRATRRNFPQQPMWNKDNHPVVNVSWKDAKAYAKWAGKRLPTEAEWEYASRAGAKGNWFAWGNVKPSKKRGDNIADESVRTEYSSWNYWEGYYDGFVYTSPVGSFLPNPFGVYDMGGNVKEWCADWYGKTFYKNSPRHNPEGPNKGSRRVLRGGSWNYGPGDVRLTKRYRFKSTLKLNYIGFRCVKDVE